MVLVRLPLSVPLIASLALGSVAALPAASADTGAGETSPSAESAAAPSAADVDRRLRELEETVRKQQEIIRQLQSTVEQLRKTPAPPAEEKPTDPPPAAAPNPPTPPADSPLRVQLRGLVQMDTRFYPSGSSRTGNESFYLRRVRPIISGNLSRHAEFMIQPGFDDGRTGLLDAFADIRSSPHLQLRFGKFKSPFSLERLLAARDLTFVERSLAQNLGPNRDVGLMLHGETLRGRLSYALAGVNGSPDGVNSDGDPSGDKELAARIFARPFADRKEHPLRGLGLGLAATYGGRDEEFQVAYRAADRTSIFTYQPGTSLEGDFLRLAPQFHFYRGPWGAMGEAYLNSEGVRRAGTRARLHHRGWFLQGSYVLTGEDAGLLAVVPRHSFDPENGHWGAFEIALRYSALDLDGETFRLGLADPTTSARSARAWTFGLNWYLDRALKLQFNYERTDFNDSLRFSSGTRDHQDVFLTRFQYSY